MFDAIFGDKPNLFKVIMSVGAAVVAVYEAATTIQDYRSEHKENEK